MASDPSLVQRARPELRVVMLSEHPFDDREAGLGGILQATAQFVGALPRLQDTGIDFHLISFSSAVTRYTCHEHPDCTLHYLPRGENTMLTVGRDTIAAMRLIRRLQAGAESCVLHGQGHVKFIVLSLMLGRNNVQTLHGLYGREQATIPGRYRSLEQKIRYTLKNGFERWYLRRIRHLIAISDEMVEEVRKAGGNPNVYRIENPIDEAYFAIADERPAIPAPGPEGLRLLFVAAITPRKGVHVLIEAVQPLLESGKLAEVTIAGTWDWAPDYVAEQRARCDELGLDRVRFTGPLSSDELLQAYRDADALVLPSLAETKPMVIAQAQCAGLPVVATAVGGVPEMINDGESGLLAAANDPADLRRALTRLADEPELLGRLVKGGRAASRKYDAAAVVRRTFEVYRTVADRPEIDVVPVEGMERA